MSAQTSFEWTSVAIPLVSAVVGGLLVHFLALSREKAAKRREIIVRGKMEVWKLLDRNNGLAADSVGAKVSNPKDWEEIVREIQLLGSDTQIKMIDEITSNIKSETVSPLYPLLMKSLQNDLRRDLGMKESKHPYFWFRIELKQTQAVKDKP
jgi:hypothetical protein